MGKGGNQGEGATEREAPMPTFSWEEIQKHNLRTDKWLVIDRKVYNITKWSSRHPGGHRVIGHYAGEDATVRVWELSRHHSLPEAGVGSPGSQGTKPPPLNGAWRRPEGKVCLLRSSLLRTFVPWDKWVNLLWGSDRDLGKQRCGEDPSGGEWCRVYRAHWDPRVRFLHPAHRSQGRPKGGALAPGLWRPQRGRWPPRAVRNRAGEEPGVGPGRRPSFSSQARGRGRKARSRPGLAPAWSPA